jgi:hypothetical protein
MGRRCIVMMLMGGGCRGMMCMIRILMTMRIRRVGSRGMGRSGLEEFRLGGF